MNTQTDASKFDAQQHPYQTTRLFDTQSPPLEMEATVLCCTPLGTLTNEQAPGAQWEIVLDRTAFFPLGGGQNGDRGWLVPSAAKSDQSPHIDADTNMSGITKRALDRIDPANVPSTTGGYAHRNGLNNAHELTTLACCFTDSDDLLSLEQPNDVENLQACNDSNTAVVYNTICVGQQIIHLSDKPLAVGTAVHGVIDIVTRNDRAQNHTAEHLLCGIIHRRFGYDNVGFALNDRFLTMDIDGVLDDEQLRQVLQTAAKIILENRPVQILYPDENTAKHLQYRSKKEVAGQLRLVQIDGVDLCACCAPHVATTAAIGAISIIDAMHYKGGMRLTVLAGVRAMRELYFLETCNHSISHLLSASPAQTLAAVQRLKAENEQLKQRLAKQKEQLAQAVVAATDPAQKDICIVAPDADPALCRRISELLCQTHKGICIVLADTTDEKKAEITSTQPQPEQSSKHAKNAENQTNDAQKNGCRYIISAQQLPLRKLQAPLTTLFGGRGGGNDRCLQGMFSRCAAQINDFFANEDAWTQLYCHL